MKNNTASKLALGAIVLAILLVIVNVAYGQKLEELDWYPDGLLDALSGGLVVIGTVLGWMNFRCVVGKIAAVLGSLMVLWVFLVFFGKGSTGPEPPPRPRPIEVDS